ncbi:hypothetical protein U1872_05650 [Sphingomonas sp. RB3P16]|uniref:hypothetical protein n=1 Tax=Parasphingomonas frigoris TaxID=3096163 RepID=UPI002FCB500F
MVGRLIPLLAAFSVATPVFAEPTDFCIASKVDPSLDVIAKLKAANLDLARPREISQLFLGPDKKLSALVPVIEGFGYVVRERANGRLLAVTTTAVSDDWVRITVPKMCAAAAKDSVDYDGWDIDVANDHIPSNRSN